MVEQVQNTIIKGGREFDTEVYNKYLRNLRTGRRAFAEGNIQEFRGWEPDSDNGITLRAYLTPESDEIIKTRVTDPVSKLAKAFGLDLRATGVDWKSHVSIKDLRYRPNGGSSKEEVFERLKTALDRSKIIDDLEGQNIVFDTLWPGNALTLAASYLPKEILDVRGQMDQFGSEMHMEGKDIANIVHTSIARFGSKENVNAKIANAFGRELMKIHHALVRDPIHATIDTAELMSNNDFLRKYEQGLAGKV